MCVNYKLRECKVQVNIMTKDVFDIYETVLGFVF